MNQVKFSRHKFHKELLHLFSMEKDIPAIVPIDVDVRVVRERNQIIYFFQSFEGFINIGFPLA